MVAAVHFPVSVSVCGYGRETAFPTLDHGQGADDVGVHRAGNLFGIADGVVEMVSQDSRSGGQKRGQDQRDNNVDTLAWENGLPAGQRLVGNAGAAVVDAGVYG